MMIMKNWMYLFKLCDMGLTTVQPIEAQIFRKKKSNAKVEDKKAGKDKYAEKIKNADVHEGLLLYIVMQIRETFI